MAMTTIILASILMPVLLYYESNDCFFQLKNSGDATDDHYIRELPKNILRILFALVPVFYVVITGT